MKHTLMITGLLTIAMAISISVATGKPESAGATTSIVAHRGASRDAPENTIAAFELAWKQGADAIEGDFYLTKDKRIVCIHDSSTKRTAGKNLSVAKSTLAELRKLDVGKWKGAKWAGQRIATLQEVLAIVPAGKRLLIEIKCGPEIVPFLKKVLDASRLKRQQIIIISFNTKVIAQAKKQLPKHKAFWLTGFRKDKKTGSWTQSRKKVLDTLKEIHADGLDCQAVPAAVDRSFMSELQRRGLELHVWTVDDVKTARYFQQLGAASITTNRPAWLREQMTKSTSPH
jgi:glycerophosphoryl diester phosphodiesterase